MTIKTIILKGVGRYKANVDPSDPVFSIPYSVGGLDGDWGHFMELMARVGENVVQTRDYLSADLVFNAALALFSAEPSLGLVYGLTHTQQGNMVYDLIHSVLACVGTSVEYTADFFVDFDFEQFISLKTSTSVELNSQMAEGEPLELVKEHFEISEFSNAEKQQIATLCQGQKLEGNLSQTTNVAHYVARKFAIYVAVFALRYAFGNVIGEQLSFLYPTPVPVET